MRHIRSGQSFKPKLLALSVAACFSAPYTIPVLANPTGATVVSGSATFATSGNTLTINNSTNAIINWQSFSINSNEITQFLQSSAGSAVLNRVVGSGGVIPQSIINGILSSNGHVFLLNPSGVVIGATARIDVAGMVTSSLNLSNEDFLNGRLRFTDVPNAGSVINQGNITAAPGGRVFLVGSSVENSGIIHAPDGQIVLAAGKSVELAAENTPFVTVKVTADNEQALNLGSLVSQGGRVNMHGALVKQSGVVEAGGAVVGANGEIRLVATKDLTLTAGSKTSASGAAGGKITLQAETGTNLISGTVEATGASAKGGTISALGVRVGVVGSGVIDASGETGGGTVLVGGDYQGKNADVQNAQRTEVGTDGIIRADARTTGDGGRVIVWADDDTRFAGSISARGGADAGNGGFIETSGKQTLSVAGARIDARAPNGQAGSWLLDPEYFVIDPAQAAAIESNFSNLGSTTIQATENIDFDADLNLSYGGYAEFIAYAGNDINLKNATITTAGHNVRLQANSIYGDLPYGGTPSGSGSITRTTGGHITTNGGSVYLQGVSVDVGNIDTRASYSDSGSVYITTSYGTVPSHIFTGSIDTSGSIGYGGGSVNLIVEGYGNAAYGNITVQGPITTRGGDGDPNHYSPYSYYGGSAGDVVLLRNDLLYPGTITVQGDIDARGGNGVTSASGYYGGGGGGGGSVFIGSYSNNSQASGNVTIDGNISVYGGNAGAVGNTDRYASGRSGGDGGEIMILATDTMLVTGTLNASGGRGGDGAPSSSYYPTDAGNGGQGGNIDLFGGTQTSVYGSIISSGGAGGNGGNGNLYYAGGYGGSGGNGGSVNVGLWSIDSTPTQSAWANIGGAINTSGGNGGNGGAGYYGGGGGDGGFSSNIRLESTTITVNGSLSANGGSGGTGGDALVVGYYNNSGSGGYGRDAGFIDIIGDSSGSVSLLGSLNANGGAGGNPGASGAYSGSYGDGGEGGYIAVTGGAITGNADFNAIGGFGGYAQNAGTVEITGTSAVSVGNINAYGGIGNDISGNGQGGFIGISGASVNAGNINATGGGGYVHITATAGDALVGSIDTHASAPAYYDYYYGYIPNNGGDVTILAAGRIEVGGINTSGANGIDIYSRYYYGGSSGGNINLVRTDSGSIYGGLPAVKITGDLITRGGNAYGEIDTSAYYGQGGVGGGINIAGASSTTTGYGEWMPSFVSLDGSVVFQGSSLIDTSGGKGASMGSSFSAGTAGAAGADAGGINIQATGNISLGATGIAARGGDGGNGRSISYLSSSQGGSGGQGGSVNLTGAGITVGSIDVSGGIGGNGGNASPDYEYYGGANGGSGGWGGQIVLDGSSVNFNDITANGGSGGVGGAGSLAYGGGGNGGTGGIGGTIDIMTSDALQGLTLNSLSATGGTGGIAGAYGGTSLSTGGGASYVTINAAGTVDVAGEITVRGGRDGANTYTAGGGYLTVSSHGDVSQTSYGVIDAASLNVRVYGAGNVDLMNTGNIIDGISIYGGTPGTAVQGNVDVFTSSNDAYVGTVAATGTVGITTSGAEIYVNTVAADGDVVLKNTSFYGAITISDTWSYGGSVTVIADDLVEVMPESIHASTHFQYTSHNDVAIEIDAGAFDNIHAPKVIIGSMEYMPTAGITLDGSINATTQGISTLSLEAGGAITQLAGSTITVVNLSAYGGGNISLGSSTNNLTNLQAHSVYGGGGNIMVSSATSLNLANGIDAAITVPGVSIAGGDVTLISSGSITSDITGGPSISAFGVQLESSGSVGSALSPLQIDATSVFSTAVTGIALETNAGTPAPVNFNLASTVGDISLNAHGGASLYNARAYGGSLSVISDSLDIAGPVSASTFFSWKPETASQNMVVDSSVAGIAPTINIGDSGMTGNITLSGPMDLGPTHTLSLTTGGQITNTGELTVETYSANGGSVTQSAAINVVHLTANASAGNVTLTNAGNSVAYIESGTATGSFSLTVGQAHPTAIQISAGGDVALANTHIGAGATWYLGNVTSYGGSVSVTSNELDVTGPVSAATFFNWSPATASQNMVVDSTVTGISAPTISIGGSSMTGDITLSGPINLNVSTGTLSLTTGGQITNTGLLTVNSYEANGGSVTQSAGINVNYLTANASAGDVTLTNAGNRVAYIDNGTATGSFSLTTATQLNPTATSVQASGDVTLTNTYAYGGGSWVLGNVISNTGAVKVVADNISYYYGSSISAATSFNWQTANNTAIGVDMNFLAPIDAPVVKLGSTAHSAPVVIFGAVDLSASPIQTLSLYSAGDVYQGTGAPIKVANLSAVGSSVTLVDPGNDVQNFHGRATTGGIGIFDANNISLAAFDSTVGTPGISGPGEVMVGAIGNVSSAIAGDYALRGVDVGIEAGGSIGSAGSSLGVKAVNLDVVSGTGGYITTNQFDPAMVTFDILVNAGIGHIVLNAYGGATTTTLVDNPGGDVLLNTFSPLNILGGINAGGNIVLSTSGAGDNNIQLNGTFSYGGTTFLTTPGSGGAAIPGAGYTVVALATTSPPISGGDLLQQSIASSSTIDQAVNSTTTETKKSLNDLSGDNTPGSEEDEDDRKKGTKVGVAVCN